MEFFNKSKVVRLRSHLNKFLAADDDEHTVRQSRNASSSRVRWTVETVEGKSHVIRLKSCSSGKYLTPSGEPFLLGMTGKRVVQDIQANKRDTSIEWEPIKEGGLVKLRAKGGKFLRANGGTPPWRNSVTYDMPNRTATQDWVLWHVEMVDVGVLESQESLMSNLSPATSFSSVPEIDRVIANGSPRVSGRQHDTMKELLKIAMAYYQASSDHHQKLARDFFGAMDHDGDGKIDQKEFIEFLIDEGYAQMTRPSFFKQLDLDRNGTLDFFEVMTLYYILKSGRPFCHKCNMFIPNTYFTCVGCLEDEGGVSVHLCVECYTAQRCDHSHNGLSRYVDNYSLLEAKLKSNLSTARSRPSETNLVLDQPSSVNNQAWNPSSAMVEVPNRRPPISWSQCPPTAPLQNVAPPVYHQTYIQNNYSYHMVQTPVAANAIVPQQQRWKVAFAALETALYVGAVGGNLCSIL